MNFTEIYNYLAKFFEYQIWKNSIGSYCISLFVAVAGVLFVFAMRGLFLRILENWLNKAHGNTNPSANKSFAALSELAESGDNEGIEAEYAENTPSPQQMQTNKGRVEYSLIRATVESLLSILKLLPIYWAFILLTIAPQFAQGVRFVFLILFAASTARFISNLFLMAIDASLSSEKARASRKALTPIISGIIWVIAIVFVLDNLGMQISSIVAGLGIVGVAVGLAGQTILADFFGYLIILLDRPFKIGDSLMVDSVSGSVEHIGIKTTHIRSSTGELMVVPNGDLTKKALSNFQVMKSRSKRFRFEVLYCTPIDKVRRIPDIIRSIVAAIPGANLQRAHFIEFGASGLIFEVAFMVESREYIDLLNAQQRINIGIMERFLKEGIEFALSSRSVQSVSK